MENLLSAVLDMSRTASTVILAVLIARAVLKHAPKRFSYVLWAVVLFRLLCPLTVESPFGLLPDKRVTLTVPAAAPEERPLETLPAESVSPAPERQDGTVSGYTFEPAPPSVWELVAQHPHTVAASVWLTGAAGLLLYSALSLLRLRRRLTGAVPLAGEERVFLADHIPSPFVLGVFRPKIYLPSGLPEGERDYILLHEHTHIRRLDYITRALAWLAVSLHWFNPLVWLSFHLAGQDMEMSCDEAVLRRMGREIRCDYSQSLLRLSVRGLPVGPLTFGSGNPKKRITNVLDYKKPATWAVTAALVLVVCVGTATASNQSHSYIDPNRITSATSFNAASRTITTDTGIVYTPADRKKDLQSPKDPQAIGREDAVELVRLINSYSKKLKYRNEFQVNGGEHHFVRLDCTDGSFYLVDHWYWKGFSFNPLHPGEDDYTTLVTYYDAGGKAGTTWQMEYDFDLAYSHWRSPRPPVQRGELRRSKVTVDGVDAELTFSMYTLEQDVDIAGVIDGVKLQPGASNWSSAPFHWYPGMGFEYPCGWLSLVKWEPGYSRQAKIGRYDGSTTSQFGIYAGWTDESRTSVSISTQPRTINNYSEFHGYWHFTVELTTGTVTAMEAQMPYYEYATGSEPIVMHPESISDEEAVEMARISARLIEAAEIFYETNRQG